MTSDARSRIEEAIKSHAVVDMRTVGYEDCWVADATEATDRIIAIVREAMLTQEPLEAAADIWNHHHAPTCDRAITAALDAAFGEEPPTTPPR